MKVAIKNPPWSYLLMLLVFNHLKATSTDKISADYCDMEDADVMAMTQWYSHVFRFVSTNQNTSHEELNDKLCNLEEKLEHLNERVDQAKLKSTERLDTLEALVRESFKQLNHKVEQMQAKSNERLDTLEALVRVSFKPVNDNIEQLQQRTNGVEIVIQRRMDGSVDFYRSWADYKLGFGNSSGEFFIGLEQLHKLTNSRPHELLVVMEDWENNRRYAKYDRFVIGSEAEKYELKQLGTYSGTAGDSMIYELGQKFTTRDQDNDVYEKNCAVEFTGAWWYKACHDSNLNGRYLRGAITEYAQGIHWQPFKGHYYSLKFVEMIIQAK